MHFKEGSGMLMFNDIIPIVDKFWKNYENYQQELKEACLAFGIYAFFNRIKILNDNKFA